MVYNSPDYQQSETSLDAGTTRHVLKRDERCLSYTDVIDLWSTDAVFRTFFTSVIADSSFRGLRWETPPICAATVDRPFEFVLIDTPGFCSRSTDHKTFKEYFTSDDEQHGVVTFKSLRKDSTLIVPSPREEVTAYGHLAAFIRHGPTMQVDALWRVLSQTISEHLCDSPMWISTAGGGVAWLHVRIDWRPKYIRYTPYRNS